MAEAELDRLGGVGARHHVLERLEHPRQVLGMDEGKRGRTPHLLRGVAEPLDGRALVADAPLAIEDRDHVRSELDDRPELLLAASQGGVRRVQLREEVGALEGGRGDRAEQPRVVHRVLVEAVAPPRVREDEGAERTGASVERDRHVAFEPELAHQARAGGRRVGDVVLEERFAGLERVDERQRPLAERHAEALCGRLYGVRAARDELVALAHEQHGPVDPEERSALRADEPSDADRVGLRAERCREGGHASAELTRLLLALEEQSVVDQGGRLTSDAAQDRERRLVESRLVLESEHERAERSVASAQRCDGDCEGLAVVEELSLRCGERSPAIEDHDLAGFERLLSEDLSRAAHSILQAWEEVRRRSPVEGGGVRLPAAAPEVDRGAVAAHHLEREPADAVEHLGEREGAAGLLRDAHERVGDPLLGLELREHRGERPP